MLSSNQPIRILHLENSPRDAELIQDQLAVAGVACSIVRVDTEQQFGGALADGTWDLILLDYDLPGYSGSSALQFARQMRSDLPVIVVSGTVGEEEAVKCLHLGAADYVLKQRLARFVPAVLRALREAETLRRRREAEAQLRENAEHLRHAQAVAKVGSWAVDLQIGGLTLSDESCRIIGIAAGTRLTYGQFLDTVHPDDRKQVDRCWRATVRDNRPYDVVYRVFFDGEVRWVHGRAALTFDVAGRAVRAVGTMQDISEPERARIALAGSEHFLRATISALSDSIVVLDDQGRILRTNQAWREFPGLNGLNASRVDEGANYLDVCERAAAEGVAEAAVAADLIRDLIAARRMAGSFEYACNSPQEERWFLCRGTRFRIGEETRVVLVHTNISARRLAEEALRKLNEELEDTVMARTAELVRANTETARKEEEIRSIVDNLNAGVISINAKGIIQSANRAVESILGYSVAEVMGQNVSMLMGEPDRAAHDGHLERYLRTGKAGIIGIGREVDGLHKDGTRIPLDLSVTEYFIQGERFFTGFLRDNRERAANLKELRQAREQAELASRAKSEFLAAMSHEIRTPMNGVIGMIDVLQQSGLKGDQIEMADLIRQSAYSLLNIINDILDYSKIEAGRLDVERTQLSAEEVVEGVCMMLDRMAVKAGVELDLFIDPAIPGRSGGRCRGACVRCWSIW